MFGIGSKLYAWRKRRDGVHVVPDLAKSERLIIEWACGFFDRANIMIMGVTEEGEFVERQGWSFVIVRTPDGKKNEAHVFANQPDGKKRLVARVDEPAPLF